MAASLPNRVPIYVSGSASQAYGSQITSQHTDVDGSDAITIYTCNGTYGGMELLRALLKKTDIYSRGSSNGAGKMFFWIFTNGSSQLDNIGQITWTAPTGRGKIAEFQYADYDTALSEQLRGIVLNQGDEVRIQVEDGSISDGYRVFTHARNLSHVDGLPSSL